MDKLRAIELFVRVVEQGSFTAVAEEMNLSKSMISKEISKLEQELGARLIHRSTRNLQLTEVGEGYLFRSKDILHKLEDAQSFVQGMQEKPSGKLKINAPMTFGLTRLRDVFAAFLDQYPDIEIDLHLSDEPVDLVEKGFDVGFRISSMPLDSAYVGRPLTQFGYHICASPDYLNKHPAIRSSRDLQTHSCIVYSLYNHKNFWPLDKTIEVKGRLSVNNTFYIIEMLKRGQGIGFVPEFACSDAIAKGELIEILPDLPRPLLTLYVLYPVRHFVPLKLQHCVHFIEEWFKKSD